MAGMELDSPRGRIPRRSARDRIVERLVAEGVPREVLEQSQMGLVVYLKENKAMIPLLVSSIFPTESDISELLISSKRNNRGGFSSSDIKDLFSESMLWLEWLMFEAEPKASLENMAIKSAGQRAVCGAVWGQNDLAYRCRTCEHDPTCAICVPCFQNGNHKDHDYSIMYTGGGCCDCGDVTAWKREGFCSKHKGTEQIQPLPEELVNSIRPVLDALLVFWKYKVILAEKSRSPREQNETDVSVVMWDTLSLVVVEMFLDFCRCSESLLSFISRRMFECTGLLDVLVRSERFLHQNVVKKLHELLLKLLGDPVFKYEFAKVFIRYYPVTVSEITKECTDKMLEKYPLLPTFSVQIFTVPTLARRLVQEINLLGVLLECLRDLIHYCAGEDGQFQASKWLNLYEIIIRFVEDTRYVLSHEEVLIYITHERPDISRAWLKLLTLLQGMHPQKIGEISPTEDEYEYVYSPFVVGHFFANVHDLLVQGVFSAFKNKGRKITSFCIPGSEWLDDNEDYRHSKVGRTSQESSACSSSSRSGGLDCSFKCSDAKLDAIDHLSIPSCATWLISECLKSIDDWLCHSRNISLLTDDNNCSHFSNFRKNLFRLKKGTNSNKVCRTPVSGQEMDGHQPFASNEHPEGFYLMDTDMCPECTSSSRVSDNSIAEVDTSPGSEAFGVLNMADWPDIDYDVSSQEISFHIPLHRLLSLILRKVMKVCYGEIEKLEKASSGYLLPSSACGHDFFGQILGGLQPCGFSAFLMEHPLRLRVCYAEVRAGMWRRNGDAAILSAEHYRAVQWFNQGLESDLFLLQCCAALAPPEQFVERIQERFGLQNYTSLNISKQNEFEAVLVHEMLTLIIQVVKERQFSGLSSVDNLKRELVYILAVGDATHSQLVKALPRDLSKSDQLQNVLDMLATYSNPSGTKQGKYSLRKTYWKELDLYHPRWNYRDLQVAEERYFRFCKVSARNAQLPLWTNVYKPLRNFFKIATSKAVLKIVRAVFFYAAFTDASLESRAPDEVLITALHLLSLALDICGSQIQTCITNYGSGIDLSHPDDGSRMEVSCCEDNLPPILAYATEALDATAHGESAKCKNQSILSLLVSLMRKYKEESDSDYSETRHCNLSSLIGTLLKKFAELNTDCLVVLQNLAPEVVSHMPKQSAQVALQSSASASDAEERRAKARERQAAIMEKMKAEQSRFLASLKSTPNNEADGVISKEEKSNLEGLVSEESAIVCSLCRDTHSQSPLCFLILLQKSRLTTFVERGPLSWEDIGQQDRIQSAGAELSNDSVGADLKSVMHLVQTVDEFPFNMETAEVDAVLGFLKERLPATRNIQPVNTFPGSGTEVSVPFETLEDDIYQSVITDIHNSKSISDVRDAEKRFFTDDAVAGSRNGRKMEPFVLGQYVAHLLRESKQNHSSIYGLQHSANLSSKSIATIRGFGPSDCDGIHISSCGHAVHQECHERYLLSLKKRYSRRLGFEGSHIVDPDLGEVLCPVCRRFANSILSASIGVKDKFSTVTTSGVSSSMSNDVPSVSSDTNCSNLHVLLASSLLQNAAKMVGQSKILNILSGKHNETLNSALEPALKKLYSMYCPRSYGNLSAPGRLSQSLVLWDTLRYSVTSAEIAARTKLNSYSAAQSCLETLTEELRSSNGYMMSVLLHVAQSSRGCNRFDILLRFSSLQLLAESICSGITGDSYLSNGDKRRGTISSLFECSDNREGFPYVQFWKRVADPVLAQDPFSSLMWAFFCLPVPFISSRECFIALVHLFYVVCVVQAMITCYCEQKFEISSFSSSLLNDVCRTMAESEFVRQYFVSSYIDHVCHPKDMIRRLAFPYLRRCALLWNLLSSSALAPLYDSHTWERSYLCSMDAESASHNDLRIELNCIRELEERFKICSLELVLKDEVVHALALRWCDHFREEFSVRKHRGILSSTPAVPFKLMELPPIYQDLLQRYIKLPCSNCKSVPEEPALCLLCGKLCSPSRDSCCRPGKCLNHAMICGAGIGVFLLIRKTTILLQRSARQALWPSPYLDAFGEEDHEMYRGKPLYLSKERYAALTYLVASHGLDQNSEVLQKTTINGL